ncbi:hypothetical protein [Mangrovibacterium lignilyticum]|uniref:hypothetical protein n=1 Tax=Mangrovibacterium lignilyticum TaxID=2668052 RepID=UPI0013D1A556|nr:hypothetical protein [Mangrovibacterium lignilyticum]
MTTRREREARQNAYLLGSIILVNMQEKVDVRLRYDAVIGRIACNVKIASGQPF